MNVDQFACEVSDMILNLIFFVIAAVATAGLYLGVPTLSFVWILPLLIGFFVGAVVLFFVWLFICSLFLPLKKPVKKPNKFCRFMIWFTMDWLMNLFRIKVTVKGREKLPKEPCVIVSNHRSDFDPMTLLAVLRERNLVYISKESNFKIPIVGPFIYRAGFLPIDRNNGRRALQTLSHAAEMMQAIGVDVGIYPEGTRSRTGSMLRFKSGAFVLAQKANAPIVVLATKGTEKISKNAPFRKTRVDMEVLEVLDANRVQSMSLDELCAYTHDLIENSL